MKFIFPIFLILIFSFFFNQTALSQIRVDEKASPTNVRLNRQRGISMLKDIKSVLNKYYYDKNFRGINIDVKFKEAEEEIKKLETNSQIFRVIARVLLEFNDSHTRFYPPGRANRTEYGFTTQIIGNTGYIVDVTKDSDAEKKGVEVGDVVQRIGQYDVNRESLWLLNYFIYQLEPMPLLPITLKSSDGKEKIIHVEAKVVSLKDRQQQARNERSQKREDPYKCYKISSELITCKLMTFSVDRKFIARMMKEVSGHSKFILDLRGNRGGFVHIGQYLTGHFFDKEVKIGDMILRNKTETRMAKPVKTNSFNGELIILLDSNSASASEVFARVMQIEKRGKVVGDRSSGAVMTSYSMSMSHNRGVPGYETFSFYGLNVTVADLIMSDGKRLEHFGVTPDYPVGPSSFGLKMRYDPIMSYAASIMGVELSQEDAAKFEFLMKQSETEIDSDQEDDKGNY